MKIRQVFQTAYVKIYQKLCSKQVDGHPLIFFLLFVYIHLFKNDYSPANIYLLSIFPISIYATMNFNFIYMTADFITLPNIPAATVIFLIALTLGCNQKWKTFIFLFNLGEKFIKSPYSQSIYLFLASALFCHEIYYHLPCKTLKDNHQYFTGFFVIFIYGAITFLPISFGISIGIFIKILFMFTSGLYAYHLFDRRLEKINKMSVSQIKDSRLLAFYLTEFEEQLRTLYVKQSKFSIHKRECNNVHCFCNQNQSKSNQRFFLRQLYQNSIRKFAQSVDTLLYEHYVNFLIKNQLFLNALHFLNKWDHSSHYSFIAKMRCIQKIKHIYRNIDSSNLYEKQFNYALRYDDLLLNLTIQIYEILDLKLTFWHQTAKQTPIMIKLQSQGLKIVDRMYNLNIFYNQTIKKYEKKLFCFDATILYAMYLLSTTNFKQYAELIIKNTSKVLQQIQILENNSSQTHAIKTIILQEGSFYIKDISTELQYIQNYNDLKSQSKYLRPTFKIIIDNASNSFCKLIKVNKQNLIGQELNMMIPDGYKQTHKEQLLKILNFQVQELGEVISSKHLHNNAKLPIKIGEKGLIMSYVSIKTMVDVQKGSCFVSVIKKMDQKTINALVSFDGTLAERGQGFNQQILMHSEFKKYLKIIVDRWQKEKEIKQQRFNVMINSMNFCIIMSSPLSKNFIKNYQQFAKRNIYPPLHIEIVNESSSKNRGIHANNNQKLVKQIKHMQNAINHDSESTASSKSSNSAINILSTFSQKDTVPIYRRIIIGFIFVITCCLIVSMVGFLVCNLQWDNTSTTDNPLNDTLNFMKIQHLTANVLLNLWDVQEYIVNPNLNQTQIKNYFGARRSYLSSIDSVFRLKFTQFKNYLYNYLRSPSSILSDQLDYRSHQIITVYNMSVKPSNFTFMEQSMTFQQLMMNYLVDFNLISKGVYDSSLLLPISYTQKVIDLQNGTKFGEIIDSSIDDSLKSSLIIAICMSITIPLLLIPLFFVLRSRLPLHQKIFDLFASIQSEMVIKQINSLTYISNIIKNYGQSSQILKTNVRQYQENTIYPKRGGSRQSSVTNQIVIGLQRFDMTSEISLLPSQTNRFKGEQTGRELFKNKTNRKSHITNYSGIKQYIQMKKTLEKRKRAGDLDFTGSESDPLIRINKKHFIIYLMALVFVIFLSLQVTATQNYGLQIKKRKNNMINVINIYTNNQLNFLLGKLYLRNGNAALAAIDPRYGLQYLQSQVQSIPTYDYINNYGYDYIYQNCSTTSKGSNRTYAMTVCMFNYSYLTLLGQFGAVFKQLFEARYNADQNYSKFVANNQTNLYQQIVNNISAKTFYLQTVANQLQSIVYSIADLVYQDMYQYTQFVNFFKLSIFITSVCWWVVTTIVGIVIILNMKRQYFKEVYMLTFLNNQMIMNNKRVESFLESINKFSSN